MKRGIVVLGIALFVVALASLLSSGIVYDATLTNVSEHNLTSTSGVAHLDVSDPDLKLYFAMDDNNSLDKVYDYTNNSNDGTVYGNVDYGLSQGFFGGAFDFDGANDYISVPDSSSLDFSDNFSFSIWVNLNESSQVQTLFSKGNYELKVGADDRPYFDIISNDSVDNWVNTTNIDGAYNIYTLVVHKGKLYASIGHSGGVDGQVSVYNETNRSWSEVGNLTGKGAEAATSLISFNGSLYAGTYTEGKVFVYNETNSSWSQIASAGSARVLTMISFNNSLYAGTNDGDEIFLVYNETNDSWSNASIIDGVSVYSFSFLNGSLILSSREILYSFNENGSLREFWNFSSKGIYQI
jgi:hypothetical protein